MPQATQSLIKKTRLLQINREKQLRKEKIDNIKNKKKINENKKITIEKNNLINKIDKIYKDNDQENIDIKMKDILSDEIVKRINYLNINKKSVYKIFLE